MERQQDLASVSHVASTSVAQKIFFAPGVTDRMLSWIEPAYDIIYYVL